MKELKYERYILSTLPALWLPLNRSAGSTLRSPDGFGHLCTVTGALWTLQGRAFDGDDNILLPNGTMAENTGTLIFWVKMGQLGVAEYIWSQSVDEWSCYHNGSQFRFYYKSVATYTWTHGLSVGDWAHIAFTFTPSGTGRGYQNGVEKASGICSTAPTAGVVRIGASSGTGNPLTGTIGEVVGYSRQLSVGEILRHYQNTKWRYI